MGKGLVLFLIEVVLLGKQIIHFCGGWFYAFDDDGIYSLNACLEEMIIC